MLFREYAKSVLSKSENTPKVFNHIWRMRQKYKHVQGDDGDLEWFHLHKVVSKLAKSI